MTILTLPAPKWDIQKQRTEDFNSGSLGDGYDFVGKIPFSERDNFTLTFPGLSSFEFQEIWTTIVTYAGYENFEWREFDWQEYKTYVFDNISANPQGKDCWEISLQLTEIK